MRVELWSCSWVLEGGGWRELWDARVWAGVRRVWEHRSGGEQPGGGRLEDRGVEGWREGKAGAVGRAAGTVRALLARGLGCAAACAVLYVELA